MTPYLDHPATICAVVLVSNVTDALRDTLWMHPRVHPGTKCDTWHKIKWVQFYLPLVWAIAHISPVWLTIPLAVVCSVSWKLVAIRGRKATNAALRRA